MSLTMDEIDEMLRKEVAAAVNEYEVKLAVDAYAGRRALLQSVEVVPRKLLSGAVQRLERLQVCDKLTQAGFVGVISCYVSDQLWDWCIKQAIKFEKESTSKQYFTHIAEEFHAEPTTQSSGQESKS